MAVSDAQQSDSYIDLSPTTDRGILKKILRDATCELKPCQGDTVLVHYVGYCQGGEKDGEIFDSSRTREKPFSFELGNGDVIKGWDIGVATMKVGEMCELIITPKYGYNDEQVMRFEVELLNTLGKDVSKLRDGSIRLSMSEKANIPSPAVGLPVTVEYQLLTDPPEELKTVTYVLGDLEAFGVPEGIDQAIRVMGMGDSGRLMIHPPGSASENDERLPTDPVYHVHLKSFEKAKRLSAIENFDEAIEYAGTLKSKANEFMSSGKYDIAIELYDRIERDMNYVVTHSFAEQERSGKMSNSLRLNIALAYLKQENSEKCIEYCQKILDVCTDNEKALFRLGQAWLLRKDHEKAVTYFEMVLKSNPDNNAARRQLELCKEVLSRVDSKQKDIFKGIMEKCKEFGLHGSIKGPVV